VSDDLQRRPLTPDDVPAMVRLLAAAEAVDKTGEHFSAEDITDVFSADRLVLATDSLAMVRPDGELAGSAIVQPARLVAGYDSVGLSGTVRPDHRGQGLGRELLAWSEGRGAHVHRDSRPDLPGELEVHVTEHVTATSRLVERAGYRANRWFTTMRRDLAVPDPPVRPVEPPLRLLPFDPAYDDATRRAHNVAFADHYGSSQRDETEWRQWFTGQRAFLPECSFLVLDGDQIAAYLLAYFWAADAEATGVREGYIGQIGSLPPWRGRGLASALITTALGAFRTAGYTRAGLDVDTENATGALGLYQRLGFLTTERNVSYVKPVE
jgi:mycothiol synthase